MNDELTSAQYLERIRGAIVAKIKSVPGTGKVYPFERYAKTEKDFRALYAGSGDQLLGFHVRRLTRRESAGVEREIENTWQIRGLLALSDAEQSEIKFDAVLEALCDAFRTDPRLGNLVARPDMEDEAGLQLVESGPVLFSGVLCHSARFNFVTRHYQDTPEDWP